MRKLLTIGEAARLVEVTPKTVRHYHGIGLLAEPERSEAGYRLYGAGELLRLTRIRRLRSFGLSLEQVALVLGEPGREAPLREVLEGILDKVETEIRELQERQRMVSELLAGEDLETSEPSPTFEMFRERLGEHLEELSAEVWEQEEKLWATLDAYDWPEGYRETWETVARHYAEHPEQLRRMVALSERISDLADVPEDAPEVEQLAEDLFRSVGDDLFPEAFPETPPWTEGPLGKVFSELLATNFSPAQRRLFELVEERGRDQG